MARAEEMIGKKFGRVTVTGIGSRHGGHIYVKAICDCGNVFETKHYRLRKGITTSCGCFNRERTSELSTIHGDSHSSLYRRWWSMRQRCEYKNRSNYRYYGGRGIKVCKEWTDYPTFKAWALSHGYREDLSIDRINNDGNYEPSNCRWATRSEQERNKRPRQKRVVQPDFGLTK